MRTRPRVRGSPGAAAVWLCAAAAAAILGGPAAAQQTAGTPSGVVYGIVRDSATGQPLTHAVVCVAWRDPAHGSTQRCAATGSSGAYRLDGLLPGRRQLSIGCDDIGMLLRPLTSATAHVASVDSTRLDVAVSAPCTRPPMRQISGVFSGHYTAGFEESAFAPCERDSQRLRADSLFVGLPPDEPHEQRRWWVELGRERRSTAVWPAVDEDPTYHTRRYFVRWRGTVRGPGEYGHMSVSTFEIEVDSVLDVRVPRRDDCR